MRARAQIDIIRQQLSQPINRLQGIDQILADLSIALPEVGRRTDRTREAVEITFELCRNETATAIEEITKLNAALNTSGITSA